MFLRAILADLEANRLTLAEALELTGCFDLLDLFEAVAEEAEGLDGRYRTAGDDAP